MNIKQFSGSQKQQKWAADIIAHANLTDAQIAGLLWWGGPTKREAGICDAVIVIENRRNLARYADSLIAVSRMTAEEKRDLAEDACNAVRQYTR